jgi:hypothetical protein
MLTPIVNLTYVNALKDFKNIVFLTINVLSFLIYEYRLTAFNFQRKENEKKSCFCAVLPS